MPDIFNLSFKKNGKASRVTSARLKKAILKAHKAKKADPLLAGEITISHAHVTGPLDLSNPFLDKDDTLIGLSFKQCTFPEKITFDQTNIAGLNFDTCQFVELSGNYCRIDGNVNLSQISSAESITKATGIVELDDWHQGRGPKPAPGRRKTSAKKRNQGACFISFAGAHIVGGFKMTESLLVAPPSKDNIDKLNTTLDYALALGGARLASVQIQQRCAILGGVNISDCHITSALLMTGTLTKNNQDKALMGQRARIDGFAGLRAEIIERKDVVRTEFYGLVDFGNAVITAIDAEGAHFHAQGEDTNAFSCGAAIIGSFVTGQSYFNELAEDDPQNQYVTEITGDFFGQDAVFERKFTYHLNQHVLHNDLATQKNQNYRPVIDLRGSLFKNDVLFHGHWEATLWLTNSKIDGSVYMGGHWYDLKITAPAYSIYICDFTNVIIKGSLNPGNVKIVNTDNLKELHKALKAKEDIHMRRSPLPYAKDAGLVEYAVMIKGKRHFGMALDIAGTWHHMHGHGFFLAGPLQRAGVRLTTDDDKLSYLRTLTSTIMGKYGPYRIIEPGDWFTQHLTAYQQSLITPIKKLPSDDPNIVRYNVSMWYGYELFRCVMALDLTELSVVMEPEQDVDLDQNAPILTSHTEPLITSYERIPPFDDIWHRPSYVPDAKPETTVMSPQERRQLKNILPKPRGYDAERPIISLRNAHVGQLQDNDGSAWPENGHYLLGGLTYDRLETTAHSDKILNIRHYLRNFRRTWMINRATTGDGHLKVAGRIYKNDLAYWITEYSGEDLGKIGKLKLLWLGLKWACLTLHGHFRLDDPFKKRKHWLRRQYISLKPTKAEFNPQPYEQIATTFRKQGQMNEYRRMLRLRSRWENACMTPRLWRPFSYIYGTCFGYGYSIKRAIATLIVAVALGYVGTNMALNKGVMVASSAYGGPKAEDVLSHSVSCRQVMSTSLYALDLFLPVVELGQEKRCHLKPDDGQKSPILPGTPLADGSIQTYASWFDQFTSLPRMWLVAVTIYKLSGWIILSLMILTFTKIFRLNVEE